MKKIFILLMATMFAIALQAQTDVWDGTYAEWTNGSGTEEAPYLIESAENLAYMAHIVNAHILYNNDYDLRNLYFKMTVDIDLNSIPWMPIGATESIINTVFYFSGHFDGDGHTVSNLYIPFEDDMYHYYYTAGLFGFVSGFGENASIKNLGIVGNSIIEAIGLNTYIGGIVGYAVATDIINCYNTGAIISRIDGEYDGNGEIGGIAGLISACSITNCYNTGDISVESINVNVKKSTVVGGIVGRPDGSSVISNCYNAGDLSLITDHGELSACGGIVGNIGWGNAFSFTPHPAQYAVNITECYNIGNISTALTDVNFDNISCGGIIGGSYDIKELSITNCYNRADITATVPQNSTYHGYSGGIMGKMELMTDEMILNINNCYHVGKLDGTDLGGILAYNCEMAEVNNCYFINECGGINGFGDPMPSDDMKTQEFVDRLNADGVVFHRDTEPYVNEGYPIFDWTESHISVGENEVLAQISFYPNPANDYIMLTVNDNESYSAELHVYDINGRLVKAQMMNNINNILDVSELNVGIYMVEMNGRVGKIVKR